MKSFIFVFNGNTEKRDKLVEILEQSSLIKYWRYDTSSCFYLLSNNTAKEISNDIKNLYPSIGRHIISELGNDYWGELTGESWHILETRTRPPKAD